MFVVEVEVVVGASVMVVLREVVMVVEAAAGIFLAFQSINQSINQSIKEQCFYRVCFVSRAPIQSNRSRPVVTVSVRWLFSTQCF